MQESDPTNRLIAALSAKHTITVKPNLTVFMIC